MHKRISKILPVVLSVALTCTLAAPCTIRAAAKPQLSASKLELKVGETKKLSVKKNKKKVTWSSAKPSIATVNSKGTVKGISAGNTVVKAKVNKTSLKCAVTVKEKETIIRRSFKLYNGQNETVEIPTGCTTYSLYELRQMLRAKGDIISASATWSSSDESILYLIPEYKKLRAIGFGHVTLTVKSGKKTFIYDVEITKENPFALSYDDFNVINVSMDDEHNFEIKEGMSFNFIDKYPTQMIGDQYSRFGWSILDPADTIIQTNRGIRLGNTLSDVYATYGNHYLRKWDPKYTYLNVDGHIGTNNMICHYPIPDRDICYTIAFVFDQNDEIISISCAAHMFHGE